jgi:hypothetical protein
VVTVTQGPPVHDVGIVRAPLRARAGNPREYADDRLELLTHLRQMALHLETAAVLERRADRSPNPTLAAVLRARAGERRQLAAGLRARLGRHAVVVDRAVRH